MNLREHQSLEIPHGNTAIWRYLSLEKFLDLVVHERLFFTSAGGLTDQYEATLPEANVALHERRLRQQGLEEEELEMSVGRFRWQMNSLRGLTLVNCWSISRHESYALWKIYLEGSKAGVAIRSTVGNLRRAIDQGDDSYPEDVFIGRVQYADKIPEREPHRLQVVTTKNRFYEFEDELRLIILHYPRSEGGKKHPYDASKGRYVAIDIESLVDEIYLSPFGGGWVYDTVYEVLLQLRSGFTDRLRHSQIQDR